MGGLSDFRGELPPFPGRDKIPMLLLLQQDHFTQLFSLMAQLSRIPSRGEHGLALDTKAQIMSRRVWEILLLLPTNPEIKQGLQEIDSNSDLASLLDPESPQRLLYTFYIIDWLGNQVMVMVMMMILTTRECILQGDGLGPTDPTFGKHLSTLYELRG